MGQLYRFPEIITLGLPSLFPIADHDAKSQNIVKMSSV